MIVTSLTYSLRLLILLILLCSILYPGVVYLVGSNLFTDNAAGSIIYKHNKIIGSKLIGQYNNKAHYFWPRPTATTPPYDPKQARASHLPFTSDVYAKAIRQRVEKLKSAHPMHHGPIPIDMVTSSASGLDPHISPAAAYMQLTRVSKARGISEDELQRVIEKYIEGKQWGIFGTRRINVLLLNIALDERFPHG